MIAAKRDGDAASVASIDGNGRFSTILNVASSTGSMAEMASASRRPPPSKSIQRLSDAITSVVVTFARHGISGRGAR